MTPQDLAQDYYEILQISPNAEPETIQRVYRLLAQRFHPDNQETGDSARFQQVHQAYLTLSDPEARAQYDVAYHQRHQTRWRVVTTNAKAESDLELERLVRLTVLEVLYARRRTEMNAPGMFVTDLEELTGRAREHLSFTLWYLTQKKLVQRGDSSSVDITAEGVDYLEAHYEETLQRRRLKAADAEEHAA